MANSLKAGKLATEAAVLKPLAERRLDLLGPPSERPTARRAYRPSSPTRAGRKLPPGGLTSPVLRRLSLTALRDALGKNNVSAGLLGSQGFDPDEDFRRVRRPGRGGRDDGFYAAWAQRYVAKCATTRQPYPQLAEEWKYKAATIRDVIKEARERKLLTPNSPGRAGGERTSKAKRLLAGGNRQ